MTTTPTPNKLPKSVQAAVNRTAFKMAMTAGYQTMRMELEQRARTLMSVPNSSVDQVIAVLDRQHVHTPAHSDACGHVGR